MSDKDWNGFFEEDLQTEGAWSNPFEVDTDPGRVSPESGIPAEAGDIFPIDEAFFGPESEYPQGAEEGFTEPPLPRGDLNDFADELSDMELDEDFDVKIPEPEFDEEDYDMEDYEADHHRVVRRARRRRTGCLGGVMYAAFILGLSTILAFVGWMVADDVLGLTKEDIPVEIAIPENFTMDEVATILYEGGVINHRWLFVWYANIFGGYDRIQPGLYHVRPMDFRAIMRSMNQRTGEMTEVRVTIPEGRTMVQTFEILEAHGVATVESLMYVAENEAFEDMEFLADIPMGRDYRLQGFLFPDTYIFYLRQSPEAVIRTMLRTFNTRMGQEQPNGVTGWELLEHSDFTLHEIVNIAAMIEREMASGAEAPRIASVIYNRLAIPMRLQIDATIQFILPEVVEHLLYGHLAIASPWNTYYVDGLPYGPIANPGMAAILGALQPESTNFLFYALHIDGHHQFFQNFDQHTAFINTPNFAHHSSNLN
ncbi:MAG: endolytic transglycosylase MltG [Oscillospiraceae bacterium]|nr:endolytic transglycosylase MltG [Oscillospiraceae bacterium]